MMTNYKELFSLNLRKIELIKKQSLLAHSYVRNIGETGSLVEEEVRNIFRLILPNRIRVTHGYIARATSENEEPLISPQIDMILVDQFVPSNVISFNTEVSFEIVPAESVLGVFEIKRTLNKTSLLGNKNSKGAIQQIKDIADSVRLSKHNNKKYLFSGMSLGPGLSGGFYTNPMFGIIGLESSKNMADINHQYSYPSIYKLMLRTTYS